MRIQTRSGFTLIELIVTIAVALVIMQIGVARYVDFNQTQSIKAQGQTLKTNLNTVRNLALTGVKPSTATCSAATSLDGYQLSFASGSYTAVASCNSGTTGNPQTVYSLPTGFSFKTPLPSTFQFLVLGNGASNSQVITIQAYSTLYYSIYVSTGGEITDCGMGRGSPVSPCP